MPRRLDVEPHLAAKKIVWIEATKDEIGIGDGRFGAAFPVTGRSRRRPCAERSDFEPATGVDPGDASTAGTNFDDIDHRQHHRMPCRRPADVVSVDDLGFPFFDEAGFRRSAAHVKGDYIWQTKACAQLAATDDASDRPRFHDRNRLGFRRFGRHGAAVRLHDRENCR